MLAFLDGNEMVVRGAVDAGCRFFTGYPITPTSTLMSGMMKALPDVGGIALQAEDEIASIGFCIGASMAGMKAMTATSGPGLSLYSENIGLAVMGETPLVIVVSQRQGPATGSATQVAQGDIQFIRWGTTGGLPVVALYPTDPAECYTLTIEAFNLAEELRAPVFLVMDKELSMTRERVDFARLGKPAVIGRSAPVPHEGNLSKDRPFQPYAFQDPGDVPPFLEIGGERITRYTTSTHDHHGRLTTDPAVIQRFIDHLVSKIEKRKERLSRVSADMQEGAETLVISYGITARSAREAVKMARERGRRVSHLMIHSIWPVPETAIRSAARGVRRVVVPELNMGQYILEVQRVIGNGADVEGAHKMDTTLLPPEAILDRLI